MATKKTRSPRVKRPTMAEQADIHDLYQRSVQSPEADCELFTGFYKALRGKTPKVLREDFCGTALLSTTWCLGDPQRRAIGVDLHGPTLEWGRTHNIAPNAKKLGNRLTLVQGDVLEVEGLAKADLIAALNFSFCVFKQRAVLRRYFERAHAGLGKDGLLILELFGGTKAIDLDKEVRDLDDWVYIWEQESFNPITNEILCHIHFEFEDDSEIQRAFTYDWRLWSIPELRDLLEEVGFARVRVYWEKVEEEAEDDDDDDDDDDDRMLHGTGEYEEITEVEQQDSWLVYLVAER